MEEKKPEIEILDFDLSDEPEVEKNDITLDEEEIEMLDFELDQMVSNEIDEMLDFFDDDEAPLTEEIVVEESLNELLENIKPTIDKVEIVANEEALEEYIPSLKDFNIKSAKKRKVVRKAMVYTIIVMLMGFQFLISNAGETLNELRVYASSNDPIRVIQNNKYGYIDYTGTKITNPKYLYGEKFVKGYAIVKNSSNMSLIIDKGGNEVVESGKYFSMFRAGEDIVAAKNTKAGLKYGILDANLKTKVKFEYDSIIYTEDVYTFKNNNTVGVINKSGKVIYEYELTDNDDKSINVVASSVTNKDYERYAVVTVNSSSQIINLNDGSIVTKPTLNLITPEENNIFYETKKKSKVYYYVQNNDVIFESDDYISMKIDSIESGVIKALNNSYDYEFISTKTLKKIDDINEKESYIGENIFVYKTYDFNSNSNKYAFVNNGKTINTIKANFTFENSFKNGIAIVKYNDGTYNYINEQGEFISELKFVSVTEFDKAGEAIAQTKDGYGVINKEGKIIIPFENNDVKMVSYKVKVKSSALDNDVFYAVKKDKKYVLYNSKGKKVNRTYYNDVIFDEEYPLFKASTDIYDYLITSEKLSEMILPSIDTKYKAYKNYIVINNKYYNYNGKMIYVSKDIEESDY